MLKIFPKPEYVSPDLQHQQKYGTEYAVYKALANQLKDALVIWSCDYLSTDSKDRTVEGECDFIVALPNFGLLFLEVKGGGINFNAATNEWQSEDRNGTIHNIHDPFEQARRAKYHLVKKLSQHPHWRDHNIIRQHVVVLPLLAKPKQDFSPDKPLSICIFEEDMDDLSSRLESILIYANGGQKPAFFLGPPIMKMIENVLSPSFSISMPLKHSIQMQEQQMINITSQQMAILQFLQHQKKVGIYGGAGTGKTILGMHKSMEFASQGLKTLFLCFNRSLSSFLYQSFLSSLPSREIKDNLIIRNAHDMVSKLSYKYKIPLEKNFDKNEEAKDKYFNEYYPEVLMTITEQMDEKFDAIVVDEGQDFNDLWWAAFDSLKKDDGNIYVFFDNNQLVQKRTQSDFLQEKNLNLYPLIENFRNSQQIFHSMESFYAGMKILPKGPDGRSIELIEVKDIDDQFSQTAKLVDRLLKENIKPHEIGIINFTRLEKKGIGPLIKQTTGKQVNSTTDRDVWVKDVIIMDSVARFKGLEKNIIILTNLADLNEKTSELYVGMSRAKHMLYVLSTEEQIKQFKMITSNE